MSEPDPHPWYGPCDGFGPGWTCSECTGLIECFDGSIVKADGSSEIVRKPTLRYRIRQAWAVLVTGYFKTNEPARHQRAATGRG